MKQLFNSFHSVLTGSGTRYATPFIYVDGEGASAAVAPVHPVTTAGTLRNFRVVNPAGVLPLGTVTPSIYVNGVISALTGVLSTTVASFTNTSAVPIVEGDTVELRIVVSSAGTGAFNLQLSVEFEATAANTTMYGYGGAGDSATSAVETGVLFDGGENGYHGVGTAKGDRAATAGTITKHRVRQSVASGAGISRVWTLYKNGVAQNGSGGTPDTRITLTGAGTGAGITTGAATFAPLAVAAGDQLYVRSTVSATTPTMRAAGSIEFVSTLANKAHYGGVAATNPSTTLTTYTHPFGNTGTTAWQTVEASVVLRNGPTPLTVESLRVDVVTAPGVGKGWTFTLRKNGAATALTVAISGTATTGTVTAVATMGDGDTYALEAVPSGTPTVPSGVNWAFLGAIPPTTVAVPDVVGDAEADAVAAITAAGLSVGTITTALTDTVPAGHVISQSPAAGTVVALGTAVDLIIAVAPGLVVTINGVAWKFRHDSMSIRSTLNGRDTLSGIIDILDEADPPTLNQTITVDEDGDRIFGGVIETLEYRAITSDPDASKDLMVTLDAKDFNALADNKTVASLTSSGGLTLKQALTRLVAELAPQGVTLAATQVDGPILPSFTFTLQTATAILDELTKLTEFVWEIDYYKVLTMWQPGSVAAPFNITDGDHKVWGDIVIRPLASDYANRIIVRAGRDGPFENTFAWYTNGVTNNFPMYLYVLQHFGQVLVDTPLETVPGQSYESVGPPGSGAVWEFHDGPRYTQYLSRAAGAPPAGNPVGTVPYPLQFRVIQEEPIVVTADDLAGQAANGVIEKLVDQGPGVSSWWELQAIANSLLSSHGSRRYTIQYSTREKGLRVGQSQTITIARRHLSGPYFITDVETQMVGATLLKRTITANETELFQGSWRDTYKLWAGNSGGAGGGAVTIGTTIPTGGTVVPHHTQHEPGGMDPMTVDSTASIGSLRTLGTGANQAAPGSALATMTRKGTRAAQPAATAVAAGTLYSLTDERYTVERSTGTVWELFTPWRHAAYFSFDFSAAITEPPALNQVRLNSATYSAVTKIWIRLVTKDARDVYHALMGTNIGTRVYLQDQNDHTILVAFTVTAAPVDKGSYVEWPVAYVSAAGAALAGGQALLVIKQ